MIEIRKGDTLRTTWEELKISIKNNTSSLNVGDEIDIELKTGEKVTLVCERKAIIIPKQKKIWQKR